MIRFPKRVMFKLAPDFAKLIDDGTLSAADAYYLVRLTTEQQQDLVNRISTITYLEFRELLAKSKGL